MCGAIRGGILALNVVFGRGSSDDSVEVNYKAVQTLVSNFENEFGSINCYELLNCDLGTDKGQHKFRENDLHLKCSEYTGKATELVRTIINNEKE